MYRNEAITRTPWRVAHFSTNHERWVAQVWIFRPGKLRNAELERTRARLLRFIVSHISKSRCGPPIVIGQTWATRQRRSSPIYVIRFRSQCRLAVHWCRGSSIIQQCLHQLVLSAANSCIRIRGYSRQGQGHWQRSSADRSRVEHPVRRYSWLPQQ